MTDLELVKACAEAMGLQLHESPNNLPEHTLRLAPSGFAKSYWPLTDDAQAMAMVRKFNLDIEAPRELDGDNAFWLVYHHMALAPHQCHASKDLNRAICLCVSTMSIRARENRG